MNMDPNLSALINGMFNRPALRTVYPLYFISLIRRALRQPDPEGIVGDIGEVETLGNSRYALTATDRGGTTYRITVEVVS